VAESLRSRFREVHSALAAASDAVIGDSAAPYAAVVLSEDVIVNGVLDGGRPLALSTWRARTGMSELPPIVCRAKRAWSTRVRIDPPVLRSYAHAVYSATDAYLARQSTSHPPPRFTRCVLEALLLNERRLLGPRTAHTLC
jgi:hypothetical protein